jgi:methyl-accepting chemotaxis protein
MLNNWSLSKKIYFGFGTIILIASILGYTGWNGISNVKDQMAVYADWSEVDAVMNEAVIQKSLVLETAFAQYAASPNEEALKGVHEAYDAFVEGIAEWEVLQSVQDVKELRDAVTKMKEHAKENHELLEHYTASTVVLEKIGDEWETTVDNCLELLETTMENVIDPAKAEAEKSWDVAQMTKWGEIDMVMNEAVIANLLKMRTSAHDYIAYADKEAWEDFLAAQNDLVEGLNEWKGAISGEPEVEKAARSIEEYLTSYAARAQDYNKEVLEVQSDRKNMSDNTATLFEFLEGTMANVVDPSKDTAIAEAEATQRASVFMAMAFSVAGILIGIILAVVISRGITKPINRIIESLTQGGEQVGAASNQVSAASQSLAEGASEQASSLEETSSSLEELSGMTKQNADNANQANVLATQAREAADKGNSAMGVMSNAIQEIKNSSDETAKIIKVIDEIAFQTNLLALNAAVEAARAGEAGKGFAVVAEEVRNLAMRSAEAAKNTNELIEGSQKNADNGVAATEEFTGILNEINGSIKKVTDLVAEVSAASNEQAQGIGQVNTAISQIDQVTQQNASNAEESASASEELNAQAQELQRVVSELTGIIKGKSHHLENALERQPVHKIEHNTHLGHVVANLKNRPNKKNTVNVPKKDVVHRDSELKKPQPPKEAIPLEEDEKELAEF